MSSRRLGCKDRRGHGSTRHALATPGRGTPWWLLVSGYDPGRVAQVGRLRNFLLHLPLCGRGRAGARGWGRLADPASDGRHVRAAATAKRLMASAAFACLRHSRCLRADARNGRRSVVRRRAIRSDLAPASVESSSRAAAIAFHATERCGRMRPIDRNAAAFVDAVLSCEPGLTLARDELQASGGGAVPSPFTSPSPRKWRCRAKALRNHNPRVGGSSPSSGMRSACK
jgi:hypothetical protein